MANLAKRAAYFLRLSLSLVQVLGGLFFMSDFHFKYLLCHAIVGLLLMWLIMDRLVSIVGLLTILLIRPTIWYLASRPYLESDPVRYLEYTDLAVTAMLVYVGLRR